MTSTLKAPSSEPHDTVDRLTYIGHATTVLRLAGTSVLTDPVLRDRLGLLRRHGAAASTASTREADVVLISHLHRDHLDIQSLRRLSPHIPLVVPRGAGELASKGGARAIEEIGCGESTSIGALTVIAVPAVHSALRGYRGRRAEALGYVIAGAGRRVYFAGDTGPFAGMSDLGPLDLALLPVWGWGLSLGPGHLDPAGAARALTLLRPGLAVPIHWGTFFPLGLGRLRPDLLSQPPIEFAKLAAELAPKVRVRILQPGSELRLANDVSEPAG